MKSGSNANAIAGKEEDASSGGRCGKPPHPHWRRREHAATRVYVVHPTQFRAVVQQLTGGTGAASPPPPLSTHQHAAAGGGNGAAAGTRTNAVTTQAHHGRGEQGDGGGGGSSRGRTLGQMHQDCLDWASADDN